MQGGGGEGAELPRATQRRSRTRSQSRSRVRCAAAGGFPELMPPSRGLRGRQKVLGISRQPHACRGRENKIMKKKNRQINTGCSLLSVQLPTFPNAECMQVDLAEAALVWFVCVLFVFVWGFSFCLGCVVLWLFGFVVVGFVRVFLFVWFVCFFSVTYLFMYFQIYLDAPPTTGICGCHNNC